MNSIRNLVLINATLCLTPAALAGPGVQISELRIDQTGTDTQEYVELTGPPGMSLVGLTYLVIGDGTGGSGVIENVTQLNGVIPVSGRYVLATATFSLSVPNQVATLAFENSDNVTHLVVQGFTGALNQDLDPNNDCVLDFTPWALQHDRIALVETENPPVAPGDECHYGPPRVGPDGSFVPGHAYRCEPEGTWQVGAFDPVGQTDTPGNSNPLCPSPVPCCLPDSNCQFLTQEQCLFFSGTSVSHCPVDGRCVPPADDCFTTECGRTTTDFCETPIPADFFAPGSEPFSGIIILGGPMDGLPDTVVHRFDAMLLDGPPETVPIELVQLNLVSCQPITVTVGTNPTLWEAAVDLSPTITPPPGAMTVTKQHPNGGVFDAQFLVQPRFTFTEVGNPGNVRILDTGAAGMPPIQLLTVDDPPWVHTLAPSIPHLPCGVNFVPGVVEDPGTLEQCCTETCHANPGGGHQHCTKQCHVCPTGACCLGGTCTLVEGIGGCPGQYMGDGTNCDDSDGDSLPDVMEKNDCCQPSSPCGAASSGLDADSDDDGLSDGLEVAQGCDPCVPGCTPLPSEPCDACGPGPHWVDTCQPGIDLMDGTAAEVDVDMNFDGIADVTLELAGATVVRRNPPQDDSVQFPGLRPIDGHLDVIDTEIISMSLTGGGVTLTAGPPAHPHPTLGAAAEFPLPPDGSQVDSFFDVFFRVDLPSLPSLYNQQALRVTSGITCVPPDTRFNFDGFIPLYPTPTEQPGQQPIAQVTRVNHRTFAKQCVYTVLCVVEQSPGACANCPAVVGGQCATANCVNTCAAGFGGPRECGHPDCCVEYSNTFDCTVTTAPKCPIGDFCECSAPTVFPVIPTECPVVPTECPAVPTECPVLTTQCPQIPTQCPEIPTQCPAMPEFTICPVIPTQCPIQDTFCPAIPTLCPIEPTQCYPEFTLCPSLPTECPTEPTVCPAIGTLCPVEPTFCYPQHTLCPSIPTFCPESFTQCPEQFTLCPIEPTFCYPADTICPVFPTECPIQDTFCPSVPTLCPIEPTVCYPQVTICPTEPTFCPPEATLCPIEPTLCYPQITVCPTDPTFCPPQTTLCPIEPTFCYPTDTICPDLPTFCPQIPTQCPQMQTQCPGVPTACPPQTTFCPPTPTICVGAPTVCPPVPTQCPNKVTECPQVPTQCPISPPTCDPFPHKMHFPQFPDPSGWDVKVSQPKILADDWQCSETGYVDDITFWGSWHQDLEGQINLIRVRIYTDIPDPDGDLGPLYSMPGSQLWQRDFNPSQFTYQFQGTGIQGWYDPNMPPDQAVAGDHLNYYRIHIDNIQAAFHQVQGTIYWLAIQVFVNDVVDPEPEYGWKTAQQHFNDDAVWADRDILPLNWGELRDPITNESLDLSFVINGGPCASCVGDINGDGIVNPSDLALLLGNWGNPGCGGLPPCCQDINRDGAVNAADLALLLGNWGPCP